MAQYELVREIQNLCRNNQMRDVFFEEVETADPEAYVRAALKGKNVELTVDPLPGGAENGGPAHAQLKYLFQSGSSHNLFTSFLASSAAFRNRASLFVLLL